MNAHYIEVEADVRYWEDAIVNDECDCDGTLIPLRDGDTWRPVVRLIDGKVMDWPQGVSADVFYKVCDQGFYYLLDEKKVRIAKWKGSYVPRRFLTHKGSVIVFNSNVYSDSIELSIDSNGDILSYNQPQIVDDEWKEVQ